MPRFVILRHDPGENSSHPRHWDLMLEQGGVLRTWALSSEPRAGASIPARQLPDHRLAYLEYQGEISGGRGTVVRCDAGIYEVMAESAAGLVIQLAGNLLRGTAQLVPDESSPADWRFELRSPLQG